MDNQSKVFRIIGRNTPKVDGVDKVTGRAIFGADARVSGMLTGKVLRSSHAHARINRVDTSRAEDLTGVAAVVTGADFPSPTPGSEAAFGTITSNASMRLEDP